MTPEASRSGRPAFSLLPALIFLCVLLCTGIVPSFAATITVTSTGDIGTGTLRQAIADATSGDTIVFDVTVTGPINLLSNNGALSIGKDITITGPSGGIIISGTSGVGVIEVTGGTVTLSNLTLQGGSAGQGGGGLYISGGAVTLDRCTISGNTASEAGGGIYNMSTLTMTNCTVSGNTAIAGNGGGIYNSSNLTMTNCTVSGNDAFRGGGINNVGWNLTMTNCTVTLNTADTTSGSGGGLYTFKNSTDIVSIKNSIISQNTAFSDSSIAVASGSFALSSLQYSLVGNDPGAETSTGNIVSDAPGLGLLLDNGGSTRTHALQSGSAAIDAGTDTGAPSTDQRGESRPQDGDGNGTATTDIGAYELATVTTTTTDTSTTTTTTTTSTTTTTTTTIPPTTVPPITTSSTTDSSTTTTTTSSTTPPTTTLAGGDSNTPPAANAQHVSCTLTAGGSVNITLSGSDQEGDPLSYSIVQNPSVGTLSGVTPNLTYTWNGGTQTTDSFTFRVHDGYHYSAPATVKIEAVDGPSNMPAIPHNQVVNTSGSGVSIILSGSDFEGASLTFDLSTRPSHGTLVGGTPNLTYTPYSDYSGVDLFYFKARDGRTDVPREAEPAWVYIHVGSLSVPNLPPVADAGPNRTISGTTPATLDGSRSFDPAGRTLTYLWSESASFLYIDNPSSATPGIDVSGDGTSGVTLAVTNTDGRSASDSVQVEVKGVFVTPGYDTLTTILLALFCALVGVRYIRRGATQKR